MSAAPYHLAERGVGVGVRTAAEVEAGLATGRLSATTLSWREDESAWIPLAARPEFAAAIAAYRSLVPPPALAFEAAPWLRLDWTAWARTMRALWGSPRATFRSPAAAGLRRAGGWVIVCATLAAPCLYLQLALAGGASAGAVAARLSPGLPAAASGLDLSRFAAFCAGFPLAMLAFVFGGACLLHAVLALLGGGKAGFPATARSLAYVGGAMLALAVIPCGWILLPFLMSGYLAVALREAHRDAAWKPWAALAVAGFCSACLAVAFMALAVWPFFRPMG
ncbi:MAG: DUF4339 domain-containing protein [Verrucomicrobia bacterium]|nr:DUF4339 domain-containing protein [Verrucomicrobiota bacterium]